MDNKDKQEKQREYHRKYNANHRPQYTHKYSGERRQEAYARYYADVLMPLQNRIDTEGFINGSKY